MAVYRKRRPGPTASADGKDLWDKVTILTPSIVTLILGLVGVYVTYSYNDRSLAQQAAQATTARKIAGEQADREARQRQQQAHDAQLLAETQQLEKLFVYISSSDPLRRKFGYEMFAALHREQLAITLIGLTGDRAGIPLLQTLKVSTNTAVRAAAAHNLASILTSDQEKTINGVIARFEGNGYDASGALSASEALARRIGVRLPLSIGLLADTLTNLGSRATQQFVDAADKAAGGSPKAGADEKVWIRSFLDARVDYLDRFRTAPYYGAMRRRAAQFQSQIDRNDWNLSAAGAAQAPTAPPPG